MLGENAVVPVAGNRVAMRTTAALEADSVNDCPPIAAASCGVNETIFLASH